ncbi:hypothetical protein ABVT39_016979 [Epinephelus coioides]
MAKFFQEVIDAWGKVMNLVRPDIKTRKDLFEMPFLYNPSFTYNNKVLVSSHLTKAGFTKIKNILDEKGQFKTAEVCEKMKSMKIKFSKEYMINFGARVEQSLLPEWRALLVRAEQGSKDRKMQGNGLNFLLCQGDKSVNVTAVKTNIWYKLLISKIIQKPAAEKYWERTFSQQYMTSKIKMSLRTCWLMIKHYFQWERMVP